MEPTKSTYIASAADEFQPILTKSFVCTLIFLFRWGIHTVDAICHPGLALGSENPIVFRNCNENMKYFLEQFQTPDIKNEEFSIRVKEDDDWFGIGGGLHSNAANRYLMETDSRCSNFRSHVFALNNYYSIELYRQVATAQMPRHDKSFLIELTFYDELFNLRFKYDRLPLVQE